MKQVLKVSLFLVLASALVFADPPGAATTQKPSLHGRLTRSLTVQGRDRNIPTLLAQRELDIQQPLSSIGSGVLSCNFDYSVLAEFDYDAIVEFRNITREEWVNMNDDQRFDAFNSFYKDSVMRLGFHSQQGAYFEVHKQTKSISGRLVGVREVLDSSNLDVNAPDFLNQLKDNIDSLKRERFDIDIALDEFWTGMSGDANVYILDYPQTPLSLTLELRVFENWSSEVAVRSLGENFFGGYAQLLIYDESGYLQAFNIGTCLPAMF